MNFVTTRAQALYIAFFDAESDRVKAENPKLKHSQVQNEVRFSLRVAPRSSSIATTELKNDSCGPGVAAVAAIAPKSEKSAESRKRRGRRR